MPRLTAAAAAALVLACSRTSAPTPPPGPPPSAARSDVALSAASVAADGTTPAVVTVTVRDADGHPVASAPVAIAYAGAGIVAPVAPTTDARGVATFKVTAATPTAGALAATASATPIADAPTLAFHGCEYGYFVNGACAPAPFVLLPPAVPASWAGVRPDAVAIADLDGNALDDVVVADPDAGAVQVLVSYGGGRFAPRDRFEAGRTVYGVVAADVTGDAIPDVVTIAGSSPPDAALVVLPGTGDGALAPARSAPLASYNVVLAGAADVDRDGDLDLVARAGLGFGVFLNAGDGTFGPLVALAAGPGGTVPGALALGDLDGDGAVDLVAAYPAASEVEVRLGVGDGTFRDPIRAAVGLLPDGVALGDVDGDGKPDVVTSNYGDSLTWYLPGAVSVLLGGGDGTLGGHVEWPTGRTPQSVAVGDLDGDGLADVVTADANGASLSVLRATGSGALAARAGYASPGIPWHVSLARLDPGARDDVVVLDRSAGTISGVLGRGGATLSAPVLGPACTNPDDVAAADLDGDGALDLVATGFSQKMTVALGNGDGTFHGPVEVDAPGDPSGGRVLALGDLDRDGRPDAVVIDKATQQLSVLLAAPGGAFAVDGVYPIGGRAEAAAIADLDEDGYGDVLVASPGAWSAAPALSVFLGAAGGALAPEVRLPLAADPWAIAVADVNGDRHLDVVLAGRGGSVGAPTNELRVLAGDGAGGLTETASVAGPAAPSPWYGSVALAMGDLDGDGDLDAVASDGTDLVLAYVRAADGSYAAAVPHVAGSGVVSVALGDVDGDGATDAVTADQESQTLTLLRGRGDGTFGEGSSYAGWTSPRKLAVARLDADAYADVVIADWSGSELAVALGSASGLPGWSAVRMGDRPSDLAVADLDRDGKLDLVATAYERSGFAVALGRGDGSFSRAAVRSIAGYPTSVSIADANGDADLDAVVTHVSCTGAADGAQTCASAVGVLLGRGDGSFADEALSEAGANARQVALGDVNGDGKLDAVVPGALSALLLLGNGDGTFQAPVALATAPPPEALVPPWPEAPPIAVPPCEAVALVDVNGDGKLDVVAGNASLPMAAPRLDEVALLLGNGDGTFQPRTAYPTVSPITLVAADLDGDGDVDVAVGTNTGRISLLAGAGDGTFAASEVPLPLGGIFLAAGDLDLDGVADLVSSSGSRNVAAHRNVGAGAYASFLFAIGDDLRELAIGDVNGDGRPDVLVVTPSGVYPLLARAP